VRDRGSRRRRKIGDQATPDAPLDINIDGSYWVVAEQNDCTLGITSQGTP
jgi:hypothetical protein